MMHLQALIGFYLTTSALGASDALGTSDSLPSFDCDCKDRSQIVADEAYRNQRRKRRKNSYKPEWTRYGDDQEKALEDMFDEAKQIRKGVERAHGRLSKSFNADELKLKEQIRNNLSEKHEHSKGRQQERIQAIMNTFELGEKSIADMSEVVYGKKKELLLRQPVEKKLQSQIDSYANYLSNIAGMTMSCDTTQAERKDEQKPFSGKRFAAECEDYLTTVNHIGRDSYVNGIEHILRELRYETQQLTLYQKEQLIPNTTLVESLKKIMAIFDFPDLRRKECVGNKNIKKGTIMTFRTNYYNKNLQRRVMAKGEDGKLHRFKKADWDNKDKFKPVLDTERLRKTVDEFLAEHKKISKEFEVSLKELTKNLEDQRERQRKLISEIQGNGEQPRIQQCIERNGDLSSWESQMRNPMIEPCQTQQPTEPELAHSLEPATMGNLPETSQTQIRIPRNIMYMFPESYEFFAEDSTEKVKDQEQKETNLNQQLTEPQTHSMAPATTVATGNTMPETAQTKSKIIYMFPESHDFFADS